MSINANSLPNQTALDTTDRLLGFAPDTNAGFSIDYTVLAKKIIEEYTGSTVAGSAQTLQTALDTINSSLFTNISANTDLDDLKTPGYYGCGAATTAQTLSNCPATSNFTMLVMRKTGNYCVQMLVNGSPAAPAIYIRTNSSSGFGAWRVIEGTTVS